MTEVIFYYFRNDRGLPEFKTLQLDCVLLFALTFTAHSPWPLLRYLIYEQAWLGQHPHLLCFHPAR